MRPPTWCGKRISTLVVVLLGAALLLPKPAAAISPDDPKVRARVERALKYLETAKDSRLGAICLFGLCFKKAGIDDHPTITTAVETCYRWNVKDYQTANNYSLGIALMFLCEVDPKKHHDMILKYVDEVYRRQMKYGSWSYEGDPVGDTSQTQYAVLGLWMAKNFAEVDVPIEKLEGVCYWLMRTQDTGGGWTYKGFDPGSLNRVQQQGVTPTLSASASGSMYMLADLLQITQRVDVANAPKSKALQAVEEAGKKKEPRGPLTVSLDPANIKNTLANADRHMGTGFAPQDKWNHYYMYALERYHSFRAKAGGAKDNKWYDQGFAHLEKTQLADGSWDSGSGSDQPHISTAFATLFLLRSAEKSIQKKMGDGLAIAGMTLPKDITKIQVAAGKIVNEAPVIPTQQILELINDEKGDELARLAEEKEAIALSSNQSERKSQLEKLRKFVGAGNYNARMIAVSTLAKNRDLENVPRLIYALTDPDVRIVVQADKGLRFISRKVGGVGLPETEPTTAQIKSAQEAWKAWYLSIRPNAELLD